EERRAPDRLREPSRLAPLRAEEHEIPARTEGGPPLLGEPRPQALLGLASALQVEDPAGVDRPPAVRRHPRPAGVRLEPDVGRLSENALGALLAGRRGLGTEVMRARNAGEEGREPADERAVEAAQEGGEGHAGS